MLRYVFLILLGLLFSNTDLVSQNTNTEKKCIDCHENLIKHKIVHPAKENCEGCHKPNGNKHPLENVRGFVLAEKIPALCYSCHDEINKGKVLHEPVTDGNCLNCHDAHQSDYPKLLLSEENKLCLGCHDKAIPVGTSKIVNIKQLLKQGNFTHSAIDSGCAVCHSPHASDNTFRFVKHFPGGEAYLQASADSFALCFSCHDSKLFEDAFTKTATSFRIGNENLHYLHVNRKKSRNCNRCHNVHGSKNPFHINETVRFGHWDMPINYKKTENGGSCFPGCHKEKKYDRFATPKTDSLPRMWTDNKFKQSPDDISTSGSNSNKVLKEFNRLKFSDIKFVFATIQIVENTDKELINVINFMKKYPHTKVEIQGYTDNLGENKMNSNLSEQRAEKVKQLMIDQGIAHYRIYTIGYGKSNPIAPNNTEKNKAKNRRVEIKLVK